MGDIEALFRLNQAVILFSYGLSFFVLGLAIALQSRRYSRLDLARSLPWLGAFGFAHGLHEWGDLFIPMQATYLGPLPVLLLQLIQKILLAGSFACLLEFSLQLLRPSRRPLHMLPVGMLAGWLTLVCLVLFAMPLTRGDVLITASALARYIIGFPAALLAAYALQRHTHDHLVALGAPHVVRMLQVSAGCLMLYAVLGGLIPAPVVFFPGNLLNTVAFQHFLVVPVQALRAAIAFVLAVSIIRALAIFDLETDRFVESMEQQQILSAERRRIVRDLHDGVIQKIYAAGLLVESARRQMPAQDGTTQRLDRAVGLLNDAILDLRRHLSELSPASTSCSLDQALQALQEDSHLRNVIDLTLDVDLPDCELLAPARADEVVAIVNEAMSNVIRHSRAQHVRVAARRMDGRLKLAVEDDGIGLPKQETTGYGLRDMKDRARLLGGSIQFSSAGAGGTAIRLDIPWDDE